MLDGVSLDQLRTFRAAADEGSFSAAGRRLRRAQSVVSQSLANLEGQLGVKLFDRSGHLPVLTDQGRALLANARADRQPAGAGRPLVHRPPQASTGAALSNVNCLDRSRFPLPPRLCVDGRRSRCWHRKQRR